MHRKDFRSHKEFEKDIYFTTRIEKYLWELFLKNTHISQEYYNNGVDNTGSIVNKSNSNADYCIYVDGVKILYEVKFAPTNGKITFKLNDLNSYIKQEANILLIYNSGNVSLKKPKDYNIELHIKKIESEIHNIKYAIIEPNTIKHMIDTNSHVKIPYMGNKVGIIILEKDFNKYFELKGIR